MKTKRNIAEYIGKANDTIFVIPSYQRGYKWGVPHKNGKNDARILVEDIVHAFSSHKAEYFIQGVTVFQYFGKFLPKIYRSIVIIIVHKF